MNADDMKAGLELVGMLDEFHPIVTRAIESLKSYGPEIKEAALALALGGADIANEVVKRYEEHGFTREESIQLYMHYANSINKVKLNSG